MTALDGTRAVRSAWNVLERRGYGKEDALSPSRAALHTKLTIRARPVNLELFCQTIHVLAESLVVLHTTLTAHAKTASPGRRYGEEVAG